MVPFCFHDIFHYKGSISYCHHLLAEIFFLISHLFPSFPFLKLKNVTWAVAVHTLSPTLGRLYEFEASLVYKVSSRTGSNATQRNLVLKNKKQKTKKFLFDRVSCIPGWPYLNLLCNVGWPWTSQFYYLCLPSAGIKSLYHQCSLVAPDSDLQENFTC